MHTYMQPVKEQMDDLGKKITELTLDLSNLRKQLTARDVRISQKDDKIRSQKIQLKDTSSAIRKLKRDIRNLADISDNQTLKDKIQSILEKYNKN